MDDEFEVLFQELQNERACPECVKCGYCCKNTPCYYGEWDESKGQCKYLTENNLCSKYQEIVEYEESLNLRVRLFGSGCCLNFLNPDRLRMLNGSKH